MMSSNALINEVIASLQKRKTINGWWAVLFAGSFLVLDSLTFLLVTVWWQPGLSIVTGIAALLCLWGLASCLRHRRDMTARIKGWERKRPIFLSTESIAEAARRALMHQPTQEIPTTEGK